MRPSSAQSTHQSRSKTATFSSEQRAHGATPAGLQLLRGHRCGSEALSTHRETRAGHCVLQARQSQRYEDVVDWHEVRRPPERRFSRDRPATDASRDVQCELRAMILSHKPIGRRFRRVRVDRLAKFQEYTGVLPLPNDTAVY